MNHVKIIGIGSYVPKKIVTNHQLSEWVDTSDEWIRTRTGIVERRVSTGITTSEMGAKASEKALEDAGVSPSDIDLIIVATITPDHYLPSTACEIQKALGATHAVCMDINGACSGFVYGYTIAAQFIQTGTYKTVLVVGAETLSKLVDWEDRGTCVLFGDGAGATVLSASDTSGFIKLSMGSDGSKSEALECKARPLSNPFVAEEMKEAYMTMKGQDVFKFVCERIPQSILELFEDTDYQIEEVTHFVLHQANERIIQAVAKRLKVSMDKFYMNLAHYGNTSAASIPLALDEMNRKGLLKENQLMVLAGFGGGLTWGSVLIKL